MLENESLIYRDQSRFSCGSSQMWRYSPWATAGPILGPRGKFIYSETYIHSKNMAVFTPDWAVMTGGSANIAFTSMWFHSEMNIAFTDRE